MPPGVKAYPDQPKLTDSAQAGTLVGSREQTIAFMADPPGHYAIPALTVIWRDTRTNQPRTATLAAQMLTVLQPPGIAPSAMPAPQARAPQSQSQPARAAPQQASAAAKQQSASASKPALMPAPVPAPMTPRTPSEWEWVSIGLAARESGFPLRLRVK